MEGERHTVGEQIALQFLVVAIEGVEIVKPHESLGVVAHDIRPRLMKVGGVKGQLRVFLH